MRGFLHAVLSMDPPGSFQSNFGIDTRTGQALGYAYRYCADKTTALTSRDTQTRPLLRTLYICSRVAWKCII